MRIGRSDPSNPSSREDLPRLEDVAMIADPRNDEDLFAAEVLIGLLQLDPGSFLAQPGWRPTLPAAFSGPGNFRMIDFFAFAGVAPGA